MYIHVHDTDISLVICICLFHRFLGNTYLCSFNNLYHFFLLSALLRILWWAFWPCNRERENVPITWKLVHASMDQAAGLIILIRQWWEEATLFHRVVWKILFQAGHQQELWMRMLPTYQLCIHQAQLLLQMENGMNIRYFVIRVTIFYCKIFK